jgi:hypothetical protein
VGYSPSNAAELSPLRRRSRSLWSEFVWRTPEVYNEFIGSGERGEGNA